MNFAAIHMPKLPNANLARLLVLRHQVRHELDLLRRAGHELVGHKGLRHGPATLLVGGGRGGGV